MESGTGEPGSRSPSNPAESSPYTDERYRYLKAIWPKNSTLVPTSRGFPRLGFVYTGVVDETTINGFKEKYAAKYGEALLVRKFGT